MIGLITGHLVLRVRHSAARQFPFVGQPGKMRHFVARNALARQLHRTASTSASGRPPTALVMLNMGGPSSLDGPVDGVGPFLQRLFSDGEIIRLGPFQKFLVRCGGCSWPVGIF